MSALAVGGAVAVVVVLEGDLRAFMAPGAERLRRLPPRPQPFQHPLTVPNGARVLRAFASAVYLTALAVGLLIAIPYIR